MVYHIICEALTSLVLVTAITLYSQAAFGLTASYLIHAKFQSFRNDLINRHFYEKIRIKNMVPYYIWEA